MSYENPIKVNGSEKLNRALGREWLVEMFTTWMSQQGDWRLTWDMLASRLTLKTHGDAVEKAVEEHQKWGAAVRVHNVYTGDVESVSSESVIAVKAEPNARLALRHGKKESERYYLVMTQMTCMKCRPDKGNRYPECDVNHPEMVMEVWRFVGKSGWSPVRYWPTVLAVDGIGFVNLANALKAAEKAKASVFDSETGRCIRYESVVTTLIMFKNKATKIAKATEAKGLEFWDNLS